MYSLQQESYFSDDDYFKMIELIGFVSFRILKNSSLNNLDDSQFFAFDQELIKELEDFIYYRKISTENYELNLLLCYGNEPRKQISNLLKKTFERSYKHFINNKSVSHGLRKGDLRKAFLMSLKHGKILNKVNEVEILNDMNPLLVDKFELWMRSMADNNLMIMNSEGSPNLLEDIPSELNYSRFFQSDYGNDCHENLCLAKSLFKVEWKTLIKIRELGVLEDFLLLLPLFATYNAIGSKHIDLCIKIATVSHSLSSQIKYNFRNGLLNSDLEFSINTLETIHSIRKLCPILFTKTSIDSKLLNSALKFIQKYPIINTLSISKYDDLIKLLSCDCEKSNPKHVFKLIEIFQIKKLIAFDFIKIIEISRNLTDEFLNLLQDHQLFPKFNDFFQDFDSIVMLNEFYANQKFNDFLEFDYQFYRHHLIEKSHLERIAIFYELFTKNSPLFSYIIEYLARFFFVKFNFDDISIFFEYFEILSEMFKDKFDFTLQNFFTVFKEMNNKEGFIKIMTAYKVNKKSLQLLIGCDISALLKDLQIKGNQNEFEFAFDHIELFHYLSDTKKGYPIIRKLKYFGKNLDLIDIDKFVSLNKINFIFYLSESDILDMKLFTKEAFSFDLIHIFDDLSNEYDLKEAIKSRNYLNLNIENSLPSLINYIKQFPKII